MRICGINIPDNKRIVYSLKYIPGIGLTTSKLICKKLNFADSFRTKDLTEDQCKQIENVIEDLKLVTGDDVKNQQFRNIKKKVELKTYEGYRLQNGLPIKGGPRRNGKTAKRIRRIGGDKK
jgi:small subunit ribosomal protein S13